MGPRELLPVDVDARVRHVMELLVKEYGYPVNGAAGIVGNLIAESAVVPNRLEGSHTGTPTGRGTLRARYGTSHPKRYGTATAP
jgi:Phage tail lysozyme